jgi:hypothetical protein
MAVSFEELAGSPRITASSQGVTATRVFRVGWADWPSLAQALIGSYKVISGNLQFIPPLAFPGLSNVVLAELNVEPFDPNTPDGTTGAAVATTTNSYSAGGARITATYRTLFDNVTGSRPNLPGVPQGTYLTYSAELGAEYQTIPGRVWNWVTDGNPKVPDDTNPGLLIPTGTCQLTWQRVPLPPWDLIRSVRGKVNDSDFLGSPPGTVMFLGARVSREFQFMDDSGMWRLEYMFSENVKTLSTGDQVGWNYFYNQTAIGGEHWVQIEDESGNAPYESDDFFQLFQFE